MTTHLFAGAVLVPEMSELVFPCCGLTFADLETGDRVTSDEARVTCGGGS